MQRFANFEVNFETGELRRDGFRVHLQEQPLQVLQALLERPGAVVTRDELRRRLWPDGVHVDFDRGLNKAVLKLRQALGDSPDAPRFIETLPRHGYRFLVPVESIAVPVKPTAAAPAPPASPLPRPAGRTLIRPVLWAAAGVAIVTAALVAAARFPTMGPARGDRISLAVLPFTVVGNGQADAPLSLGMADALITRLGTLDRTIVRPTGAIVGYLDRARDARRAGEELSVDYVLEGTVQRDAERVRVTVRLLRQEDGQQVWSASYDEAPASMLALQDAVSDQVAAALRARFLQARAPRGRGTTNVEAYDAYLRGRLLFERRDPDSLRRAIDEFRRAASLDPDFALAYAGEVQAHGPLLTLGHAPVLDALPHLQQTAARALALAPDLAEVQTAAALVRSLEWNWQAEEVGYRRAIALNPNYELAYRWYAFLLESLQRHDEALELRQRAAELDPLNPTGSVAYAAALQRAGRSDEAIREYRRLLDLQPDFTLAYSGLGPALFSAGRHDEAIDALRRAGDPGALGYALARSGRTAEAQEILASLHARRENAYVSPLAFASIHAGLGQHDEAFAWLERAYEERTPWLMRMNFDWKLAPLRGDERFEQLAARVGLPSRRTTSSSPSSRSE